MSRRNTAKAAAVAPVEEDDAPPNVFSVKRIVDSDDAYKTFLIHWDGYDNALAKYASRSLADSRLCKLFSLHAVPLWCLLWVFRMAVCVIDVMRPCAVGLCDEVVGRLHVFAVAMLPLWFHSCFRATRPRCFAAHPRYSMLSGCAIAF